MLLPWGLIVRLNTKGTETYVILAHVMGIGASV